MTLQGHCTQNLKQTSELESATTTVESGDLGPHSDPELAIRPLHSPQRLGLLATNILISVLPLDLGPRTLKNPVLKGSFISHAHAHTLIKEHMVASVTWDLVLIVDRVQLLTLNICTFD